MALYEYKCKQCGDTTESVFPMAKQPSGIQCECGGTKKQVYGVAEFVFAGGLHNFHEAPSLGAQRKKAVEDMKAFCKKTQKKGPGYQEDNFQFDNPRGKSGVPQR